MILFSNDGIVFDNANSDNVTFFSNEMGLNTTDLNDMNLDDDNFDEDDFETIIHVRFVAWFTKHKQRKACKKEISK